MGEPQNIIELGFSVERVREEQKEILILVGELFGKLKEYSGTQFNPLGGGGLADLKKSVTDSAKAMGDLTAGYQNYNKVVTENAQRQNGSAQSNAKASQSYDLLTQKIKEQVKSAYDLRASYKDSSDSFEQLNKAQIKNKLVSDELNASAVELKESYRNGLITAQNYAESLEPIAAAQLAVKISNQDITKALNNMERQTQSSAGANDELKASLNLLTQQYDKLSISEKESEGGQAMLKQITAIDQALKESEGSTGRFQRLVGNYSGSLAGGFGALQEELLQVNKQLAEMELRGKAAAGGVKDLTPGNPIGFDNGRHKEGGNVTDRAGTGDSAGILNTDAAAYQKLTVQQKILEGSLTRQAVGFKTVNQELRNAKNTLDALTLAGLENSEGFEKLNLAYASTEQRVKDLHGEQAILSSDAPALTALTAAARGIGGAYALGAGGAALFADGNEKVEKELQKLVAVMTFLQGLEEATKALKDRNAIATALEESATKALNFVKAIEASLFGKESAAIVANTTVKDINTVAIEGNAEATVLNTEAMEATIVATEGAEAATVGLSTALLTTGVGAIIIAITVAVGFLASKLIEMANADEKAIKTQAELAQVTQKLNDLIKEQVDLIGRSNEQAITHLKGQLDLTNAANQNKYKQFAIEKQLAAQEADQAARAKSAAAENAYNEQAIVELQTVQTLRTQQLFELNEKRKRGEIDAVSFALQSQKIRTSTATDQLTKENALQKSRDYSLLQYNILKNQETALQETLRSGTKDESLSKSQKEKLQERIDGLDQQKKAFIGNADFIDGIIKKAEETETAVKQKDVEETTFSEAEKRKVTLESIKLQADAQKDKNSKILADDKSTLDQRLAALKSNAEQEKIVNEAEFQDVRGSPSTTPAQLLIAKKDLAAKNDQVDRDYAEKKDKTNEEYNDRLLEAQNAAAKNLLESDAAVQAAISSDLQKELEARLGALQKGIDDRTKIIIDDYNLQLTLAKEHGKTQEEQDKLASDRDKALVDLTSQTQKQIYDITISWGEKKFKAIQDLNKSGGQETEVTAGYNAQTEALNESLLDQTTSYSKYVRTKRNLDREYIKEKDASDVEDDAAALKRIKDYEETELASKKRLAEANLAVATLSGNNQAVINAKSEVDAIAKLQADARVAEKSAQDKYNADKKKQTDDAVKPTEEALKLLHDREAELAQSTFETSKNLVDSSYEARIALIQRTMEVEDIAADNQIAAVQRSTLSQRDQQAELIILQAQKQARDTAQKRQEIDEKRREAKFDQGLAVAKTLWSTEQAIMKDTAGVEWPLSLAIGAVDAALGAAAVAQILAQPLPSYGDGTDNHPGGWALVGERYKPEEVKIPGQDPFIISTPTLLEMPGGSSVTPLEMQNIIHDIGWGAIARGAAIVNAITMDSGADQIIGSLDKLGSRMERAFKKSQKAIKNIVHVHVADPVWEGYLDQKVRGRR